METDLPLFFVMLTPQVMNEIEAIEIILETKASDSHEMTQIHETVDGKEKEPQDLAERTDSAEASITHRLELMREALEFDSCEAYHFDIIIRGQRLIGLIDSIGAHSQSNNCYVYVANHNALLYFSQPSSLQSNIGVRRLLVPKCGLNLPIGLIKWRTL